MRQKSAKANIIREYIYEKQNSCVIYEMNIKYKHKTVAFFFISHE